MKRIILVLLLLCTLILLSGCACKHENTSLINTIPAQCEQEGYSGDLYCNDCQETLERGIITAALEHIYSEPYHSFAPTCTTTGQTGSIFCTLCDTQLQMSEEIPATGHTLGEPFNVIEASCAQEGYTGDAQCSVCGEIILGEVIPRAAHQYVDNICTVCEWRIPGMYVNDQLEITWDQLVNAGYIKVNNNSVTYVADSITGLLVIDESITHINQMYSNNYSNHLDSVYLPPTLQKISSYAFAHSNIQAIRFFGNQLTTIGRNAFEESERLNHVIWPETVSEIGDGVFDGCISLESITIPETVTAINSSAFRNCISLKNITLPDSLLTIESSAFAGSGLESLIIPTGVILKYSADSLFKNCINLREIDLSSCTVDNGSLYDTFSGCTSLMSIKFPSGTTSIYNALHDCVALEELIIPEGVSQFEHSIDRRIDEDGRNGTLISVKRVVWPTTLIDGSELFKAAPSLKEIYYTGSKSLWNLTSSKDLFSDVCYAFNYSYGSPFTNMNFKSNREIEAEKEAQDLEDSKIYRVKGFQEMQIAISLDEYNNIKSFKIVEHNETPMFGAALIDAGFDNLIGQHISTAQIDVQSGATMTSNAINNALKAAASNIAAIQ